MNQSTDQSTNQLANQWPQKTRELHNHHFDSTIWNNFKFRDDDIVIASYGKSGTTWTQQIVAQLLWDGSPDPEVGEISPWVDLRVPPAAEKLAAIEAQTHRRFLKTHLPVDALVFSPEVQYLYVARDGRDIVWSLYNHHANATPAWYEILNDTPGRVGPPIQPPPESTVEYFRLWLEQDGYPFWSLWENVRSWWEIRQLPNVMLLHYAELKRQMPEQIRRIAEFLDVAIDESKWPDILQHCSFDYMKQHAVKAAPMGDTFWQGGAQTFVYKGTNNRWKDSLTAEDIHRYEQIAQQQLGEECAHWLATGELGGTEATSK